ncbi:MAG: hypothetical protein SV422_04105 [Pseudomonadota bacterium]|nr:hypothetical protein [Pseudomonadota bacterium]
MKKTLTLSAVLLSLSLAPAAFANGAQEQSPAQRAANPQGTVTVMHVETTAPSLATITRNALQGLDNDVRATLLTSLRESSLRMLQLAAPLLGEAGVALAEARTITAR